MFHFRCCSQTLPATVLTSLTLVTGTESHVCPLLLANFSFQVLLSNSASCHQLTPVPLASPQQALFIVALVSFSSWGDLVDPANWYDSTVYVVKVGLGCVISLPVPQLSFLFFYSFSLFFLVPGFFQTLRAAALCCLVSMFSLHMSFLPYVCMFLEMLCNISRHVRSVHRTAYLY